MNDVSAVNPYHRNLVSLLAALDSYTGAEIETKKANDNIKKNERLWT